MGRRAEFGPVNAYFDKIRLGWLDFPSFGVPPKIQLATSQTHILHVLQKPQNFQRFSGSVTCPDFAKLLNPQEPFKLFKNFVVFSLFLGFVEFSSKDGITYSKNIMSATLLTRKEVAAVLRVTTRTVRTYDLLGKLHPIKINSRLVRYRQDDVQKLISTTEAP